ncbi:MAG TPA: MJ1255/VC2487 family glycosyltransferase [Terriglobales bacterium]|nr:MJ1255/VC2487 family glycosyltransferase [Terriglobales bacterium]
MARILYGVNGEGSGHSTRAREVLSHLVRSGHTVHVVSFDRGLRNLKDDFQVTEIYGLRFAYVNDRVRYRRTLGKNLVTVPQAARSLRSLLRQVDDWGIELVITDFEPLSCRVARRRRLPLISIDNQHCLTNAEISYPPQYRREAAAAKLVTRLMTPGAGAYLVISFFQPPVRRKGTWIFPPILRREVLDTRPTSGDHVLVYVTSPSARLVELLRRIRGRFLLYGFDREGEDANLTFKRPSLPGFLHDLASCRAVIANAGFSLVSEALHLGKPYLAYPVQRQFEQVFNAYYVDKMGYGAWWDDLNKERIESFLYNLDSYRERLAGYPRQDNSALLARLDSLIAEHLG